MKKGLTEMVFILDRSGSMAGLESDTIGGFNGMLKKQQQVEGEAVVTTVLFDDQYEILHDRIAIEGISPMTDKEYYVRGCTALYDAIGRTITKIKNVQKHTSEAMRAEKVIFVITTDGMENASKEYGPQKLNKLITQQKEAGWEFIFLGANMDAIEEAGKIGIEEERAATYTNDAVGVQMNFMAVGGLVQEMRTSRKKAGRGWKADIEKRSNS